MDLTKAADRMGLCVLVTGVGGQLGMSIFKALRMSTLRPRIVGTDARPISVGLFCADAAYTMPHVLRDEGAYLSRLKEICTKEGVALICFGTESELERMAPFADEIRRDTGAIPVVTGPGALDRMMDKWKMVLHLRGLGLHAPDTALADDEPAIQRLIQDHSFPLVLKPRHGLGSKSVFVIRSEAELHKLACVVPQAIVQEYLFPDDQEYTVGTFTSQRTGYVGEIIFRRVLDSGGTYKAEVVLDEEIASMCRAAVAGDDVWGPINLQLRKTRGGVRIFEINPRISGSAVMRAHFGFNEPEMCLVDLVLGQDLPRPRLAMGYALRYWEELYLEPGQYPTDPSDPSEPFDYPSPGIRIGRT